LRVYIAGALSSKEKMERNPSQVVTDYIQNIHKMCKVAAELKRKGYYPYIPALDFLLGVIVGDFEENDYRDIGISFLAVCDAVLVISDSWGVQQEIEFAQVYGLPVFYSIEDLPNGI
jgi:hypothetical protein